MSHLNELSFTTTPALDILAELKAQLLILEDDNAQKLFKNVRYAADRAKLPDALDMIECRIAATYNNESTTLHAVWVRPHWDVLLEIYFQYDILDAEQEGEFFIQRQRFCERVMRGLQWPDADVSGQDGLAWTGRGFPAPPYTLTLTHEPTNGLHYKSTVSFSLEAYK